MLYKAYVRVFQACFSLGARCLRWRRAALIEGEGALDRIPALLRAEGVQKPLIVGGPSLLRTGTAAVLITALNAAGISQHVLFTGVRSDPTTALAEEIADLYRVEGCDGIIAIGGGSPMDAAKGAAACIARPGRSALQLSGMLKVRRRTPVMIAVPTTAGTGSETTIAAVLTDANTHHKAAIGDLCLIPRYAVLDPVLSVGLPPHITAMTGMDALTHAVESYLCWTYNTKETLRCAEEAVRLIYANLERAYQDGGNLETRAGMLKASYLAGVAFTRTGVGYVHAIAHTIGGLYGVPHGQANAALLPIVLADYGRTVEHKLARLADVAGIGAKGNAAARAAAFIESIRGLNARMNLPDRFDCIRDADIDQMVAWALKEANPIYPVPVLYNPARCRAVIERARAAGD